MAIFKKKLVLAETYLQGTIASWLISDFKNSQIIFLYIIYSLLALLLSLSFSLSLSLPHAPSPGRLWTAESHAETSVSLASMSTSSRGPVMMVQNRVLSTAAALVSEEGEHIL